MFYTVKVVLPRTALVLYLSRTLNTLMCWFLLRTIGSTHVCYMAGLVYNVYKRCFVNKVVSAILA